MAAAPTSAGTWDGLGLTPAVLDIVKTKLNFQTMTPVQAHAIPPFLKYKDVAVETLAFVLPMFEMLLRRKDPLQAREIGAIIISPTRELATQISRVVSTFTEQLKFTSLLLIGGTGMQEDVALWRKHGAQILIGTPGRMLYFLEEVSDLKLRELDVLILDEADRLLDLGFEVALNSILRKLPKQRRTGLFSATQTKEVDELVRAGLRNPMYIQVKVENKVTAAPQKIPASLHNLVMKATSSEKLALLVQTLIVNSSKKFIVYFLTCACVDYFWMILSQLPELKQLRLSSLHGKVPHAKRSAVFQRFVDADQGAVLLTTDVAARGLDLPDVDWIIQYDLPQDPQMYVHRIGRTARMGREGCAVAFLTPQEDAYIAFLKRALEVPVEEIPKPEVSPLLARVREMALKDYQIVKKGHIAFVSYVRAYREHKCSYLLPWKLLDFGELANGFCLLKLPRMPELQGKELTAFEPVAVDLNNVPYKDAIMEKQRVAKRAAIEAKKQSEPYGVSDLALILNPCSVVRKRPVAAPTKVAPAKQVRTDEPSDGSADEEEILREYAQMKKNKKQRKRAESEEDEEEEVEESGNQPAEDILAEENGNPAECAVDDDGGKVGVTKATQATAAAMEAQHEDKDGEKETAVGAGTDDPKRKKKRKHKKAAFSIPIAKS